jgi:hypothetical protein
MLELLEKQSTKNNDDGRHDNGAALQVTRTVNQHTIS